MFDSTIGIKIANGEYYSILSEGSLVRRRLILTTASDNQERVQINIFKGKEGEGAESASFLGSLLIEDIEPSQQGAPEIELILGVDAEGRLSATACDKGKEEGGYQSLNVNLDFPWKLEAQRSSGAAWDEDISLDGTSFVKNDLTREESSFDKEAREKKPQRRWAHLLFLGGFILLGIAIVMLFLLFREVSDKPKTSLNIEKTSIQEKAEPEEVRAPEVSAAAATEPEPAPPSKEPEAKPPSPENFRYLIKRGDTLWDLSNSFYRTPWLYRKIAKDNNIVNPDLIYAGTKLNIFEN